MPAPKLRPVGPEHHHPAAGHVLAGVVAHALDHGDGPRVADAEPLPHLAPQEDLAGRRPVEDDVAGDDVLLGGEGGVLGRPHHDAAARQALAQVVVGVAEQPHGHAPRHEGAEALAGRAPEGEVDGAVGQAGPAVAPGDLVAEQGARPCGRRCGRPPRRSPACRPRWPVGTPRGTGGRGPCRGRGPGRPHGGGRRPRAASGGCRMGERSRPAAFQWSMAAAVSSRSTRPTASSSERRPRAARYSRTSSAMYSKNVSTNSGLPGEALRAAPGSGWRSRPGRCPGGRRAS